METKRIILTVAGGAGLLILAIAGVRLTANCSRVREPAKTPTQISPTKTALKPFPPEFWSKHYREGTFEGWKTYISADEKIAFKYPGDMEVIQGSEKYHPDDAGNIYILPKTRIEKGDFDLTGGIAVILAHYQDYEIQLESGSKVSDYSIDDLRYEDSFSNISSVTFQSPGGWKIIKAEDPKSEYQFMYVVYKTEAEKRTGNLIIGTIVSGEIYDLGNNRQLSDNNRTAGFTSKYSNVYESQNLKISMNIPGGYKTEESLNPDNESHTLDISKPNCQISIANNPEYVGFSTSGSLCANAGPNMCNFYGKYLIPSFGTHMTVVRDANPGGADGLRGVVYADNLAGLSASLWTEGYRPACVQEMLGVLYSISY